jgi:hypothetical protein
MTMAASQSPLLIRGDTTFLREDFSVLLPLIVTPDGPPIGLRFDFVVRTREAEKEERIVLLAGAAERKSYPQRDAVLFALRELTGKDVGTTTLAWQNLFPHAEEYVEADRLKRKLLRANPLDQETQLRILGEGKRLASARALARAIPELRGSLQEKARSFLTDQLAKADAESLRDRLRDEDAEMRLAAVRASTRDGRTELVPDLIRMVGENETSSARLARESLKKMTGRDFETPREWSAWWQSRTQEGEVKSD